MFGVTEALLIRSQISQPVSWKREPQKYRQLCVTTLIVVFNGRDALFYKEYFQLATCRAQGNDSSANIVSMS